MTLGVMTRKFRIVVQGDEEIWVIEHPPEGSDTVGGITLVGELIEAFASEDLKWDKTEHGPIEVYLSEGEPTEEEPDADSCAFVVCLTRPATVDDGETIVDCLRKWLEANHETAEVQLETPRQ